MTCLSLGWQSTFKRYSTLWCIVPYYIHAHTPYLKTTKQKYNFHYMFPALIYSIFSSHLCCSCLQDSIKTRLYCVMPVLLFKGLKFRMVHSDSISLSKKQAKSDRPLCQKYYNKNDDVSYEHQQLICKSCGVYYKGQEQLIYSNP